MSGALHLSSACRRIKERSQVIAIKLKTSPARLAQLLQPSLAFCFSLQQMTAHRPVRRHWLQAKTKCYWGLQQLCKSCRTCFKFYWMFYFTCDRSLNVALGKPCSFSVARGRSVGRSTVKCNETSTPRLISSCQWTDWVTISGSKLWKRSLLRSRE